MSGLCLRCRIALRHRTARFTNDSAHSPRRTLSVKTIKEQQQPKEDSTSVSEALAPSPTAAAARGVGGVGIKEETDITALLSKPTWSVRSLLPSTSSGSESARAPAISTSELHHLLRLSALPLPQSAEEEAALQRTLAAQLHFVREVQRVDTVGVEPLQALRDETAAGVAEGTVGLDALRDALAQEKVTGRMKRPRRRATVVDTMGAEDWDVLRGAEKSVGRYFVVDIKESGKGTGADSS